MSRLILIRHAQSVADVIVESMRCDPLYRAFRERMQQELITEETEDLARELHHKYCLPCGINDVGLTLEGVQQISNLSCILTAIETRPKKIWCSPLRRTRATLEHLNAFCPDFNKVKVTVAFDDRLIERQRGQGGDGIRRSAALLGVESARIDAQKTMSAFALCAARRREFE